MNMLQKLKEFYHNKFGEWKRIGKGSAEVTVSNPVTGERTEDAAVIVQENTKTGKRRAYVKMDDGSTKSIDYDLVRPRVESEERKYNLRNLNGL